MKMEMALNLILLVLGILVAIAPWTFAPVCMLDMRCHFTRDIETVFGGMITLVAILGLYKNLQ
ncbi:MAG: DUF4418 family protein [Candidatus Thorarchaeota archaeon]|jgi:hypothetical protein